MTSHVRRGADRRQTNNKISGDSAVVVMGTVIFALVSYLSLRDPSVEYGRAVGATNLAIILAVGFASVVLSSIALQYLIDRKRWSTKIAALFFTLAFLMSAALSDGALLLIDSRFEFSESVHSAKVIYFCTEKYNPGRCVDQLTYCPQCKKALSAPQRQELQAKLKLFADKMDHDALTRQQAAGKGGPLTEVTDDWRKRQQRAPASENQNKAN